MIQKKLIEFLTPIFGASAEEIVGRLADEQDTYVRLVGKQWIVTERWTRQEPGEVWMFLDFGDNERAIVHVPEDRREEFDFRLASWDTPWDVLAITVFGAYDVLTEKQVSEKMHCLEHLTDEAYFDWLENHPSNDSEEA